MTNGPEQPPSTYFLHLKFLSIGSTLLRLVLGGHLSTFIPNGCQLPLQLQLILVVYNVQFTNISHSVYGFMVTPRVTLYCPAFTRIVLFQHRTTPHSYLLGVLPTNCIGLTKYHDFTCFSCVMSCCVIVFLCYLFVT